MSTETEIAVDPDVKAFDEFLHNFGDLDPIPVGATALCVTVSKRLAPGEVEPYRHLCCPICLALSE